MSAPTLELSPLRSPSMPSVAEILAIARRHKLGLLLALVLPVLAAVAIAYCVTPQYVAYGKILVRSGREFMPQVESGDHANIAPSVTMQETIDTEVQILNSNDLLREVVRAETPERLYPALAQHDGWTTRVRLAATSALTRWLPAAWRAWLDQRTAADPTTLSPTATTFDLAVEAFGKDVGVAPVKLSNVIDVSVRNADRAVALDALHRLINGFEMRHQTAFSTKRSPVLAEQVKTNLAELSRLEAVRATYRNQHQLYAVNEQRSTLIQQRAHDMAELSAAKMHQASLREQIAYLKDEMGNLPKTLTLETGSQESPVLQDANRRLNDLLAQQQAESTLYGENSPHMRKLRASIAATRSSIHSTSHHSGSARVGPNPLRTLAEQHWLSATAELVPLSTRINDLQQAIRTLDDKLRVMTTTELTLLDADRRINELETATGALRKRLEDARFLDELDRAQVNSLSVIEQPTALPKPLYPRKRLFVAAGLFLGLVLASLRLLLALTFGRRFLAVETVERVLGVPVLLLVPPAPPRRLLAAPMAPRLQPVVDSKRMRAD